MRKLFTRLYIFIILALGIVYLGADSLTDRVFESAVKSDYQDLSKGEFYLLTRLLKQYPQEEWPEQIRSLQQEFGYPISILPLSEALLQSADKKGLISGDIVFNKGLDIFFKRIENSSYVLSMGSFEGGSYYAVAFLLGVAVILVGTAIAVFLWIRPLWRDLNQLASAAADFGKGALDSRVGISSGSAITAITSTFNDMAGQIQHLIRLNRELYSGASHELRTPISRMRFALEIAKDIESADKLKSHLDGVTGDLDELESLVKELLIYARFEREKPELAVELISFEEWVHSVVAVVSPLFDEKKIIVQIEDNENIRQAVFDRTVMGRALSNLLTNGARFADSCVEVLVKLSAEKVVILVDDDGPGIPEADRERVFEPFVRLKNTKNNRFAGHGLGLAIARRAVQCHGGDIKVLESPLGGARFSINWKV